jgi:iron complex transport system ATP-binding protein
MTTLSVTDLAVRRGGASLLSGIDLAFGPTGSVALIGPNGAGKTTLLKILAGLQIPTGGHAELDGRDVSAMPPAARARAVGFLPQHFEPHWDLSVAELIDLGAQRGGRLSPNAVPAATATFELAGLQHRRWSTLSGGERARVLLAMVLVTDPPILLADEPAAALDIRHRLDVVRTLANRGRERLSIVVVHDLDLAFRYFDRIILLDRGKLVADAPARTLIDDPRLDRAFGVSFERIQTTEGPVLQARSTSALSLPSG